MKRGDHYGYLTVLETLTATQAGHPQDGMWARVRCDCGMRFLVRARHLRWRMHQPHRSPVSCGCKAPLNVRNALLTRRAFA